MVRYAPLTHPTFALYLIHIPKQNFSRSCSMLANLLYHQIKEMHNIYFVISIRQNKAEILDTRATNNSLN